MPAALIDPDGSLFETVCQRLEDGESLVSIAKDPAMPGASTVHEWIEADTIKAERYARARRRQARHFAERINETAERALSGEIEPDQARVAIDAFKWTASKMDRANYGDTAAQTTVNVAVGVTVIPEDRRAKIMEMRRQSLSDATITQSVEVRAIQDKAE